VAVDAAGVVYVADMSNSAIRRVDVDGTTSTLAGAVRVPGSADGAGTDARFQFPHGIAVGPGGDIFVADTGNSTIRRVTATGVVTTVAGLARHGGTTDGPGADARFATPYAVAVGPDGTVFVADTGNHTIRTISPAGVVATLAGTAGQAGIEDGVGTAARFNTPRSIAVGVDGTVYVGQQPGGHAGEHRIRRIAPDGTVTTVLINRGLVGAVDVDGVVYLPDGPVLLGAAAATLEAPSITTHPASQSVEVGRSAMFNVAVNGAPTPTVQWQTSTDGGATWSDLTDGADYLGTTSPTMSIVSVAATVTPRQVRAVVTNVVGSATSNAATLTGVPGGGWQSIGAARASTSI
jgi:sugar lactone lactonase YvrE